MAYVAVRGGARAIEASLQRLKYERLRSGQPLDVGQVGPSLGALVDQVMSEASLYDTEVAALAIKQAEGSPEEAVFLLRAFRSTVERIHQTVALDGADMFVERRLSAAFKDIPGGQWLGATTDYSHRLIDFRLGDETPDSVRAWVDEVEASWADFARHAGPHQKFPKVVDYLRSQGLLADVADDETPPSDVTKGGLTFPTDRSQRLQTLTRGQTGTVTSLGYASLRGYGALHPTVGDKQSISMTMKIGMDMSVELEASSDNAGPDVRAIVDVNAAIGAKFARLARANHIQPRNALRGIRIA